MIQVEPIYLVVSGERSTCRIYLATRFREHAQAFAAAFAHDPARPRVEEFQAAVLGADFGPGLKPFTVTLGREGPAVHVDPAPVAQNFGYFNGVTRTTPNRTFHVWARNAEDAECIATARRASMLRKGEWVQ